MRARRREADLLHRLAEQLAVFGLVDGFGGGADHLDAVLVQHTHAAQRQRGVQRGLPAHGGQQRKAAGNRIAFLGDDLGDDLRRDRLDIGRVGQVRIGHDRRRIGIDQDDPIALGLQRLAGLRARIVEFAGLADDDRPGADDQDRGDVGPFGHIFRSVTRDSGPGLWPPRNDGTHKKRARLTRVPQPAPGLGPARGVFRREMRAREGVRPRSAQEPSGA